MHKGLSEDMKKPLGFHNTERVVRWARLNNIHFSSAMTEREPNCCAKPVAFKPFESKFDRFTARSV